MLPKKISREEVEYFGRGEFGRWKYVDKSESVGFSALVANAHGEHPRKRMAGDTTRVYYVIGGAGKFSVDSKTFDAAPGDMFIIPPGSAYGYRGELEMFEFNVSPSNTFSNQKVPCSECHGPVSFEGFCPKFE